MTTVNFSWAKEQLTEARTIRNIGDSALLLLAAWEKLNMDNNKDAQEVVAIFSKLALGHALVVDDKKTIWIPATPGQLRVGDTVRVRSDAFSGDLGRIHNGRSGSITGIRYGDIVVTTKDDKLPKIDGAHYSPFHLEKLI